MTCSKCGGEWVVKIIGKNFWQTIFGLGKKRYVCSKCGYIDTRDSWVNGEYIGPKDADPNLKDPKKIQEKEDIHKFYDLHEMPCCGSKEYISGPTGGICTNIKCSKCGTKFNVSFDLIKFIERI